MQRQLKTLIWACCFSFCSIIFAQEQHAHADTGSLTTNTGAPVNHGAGLQSPGYCQIEVINNSYDNVRVYGVFDDGALLQPFSVYAYGAPQYINLFYYGYCHAGMTILIDTYWGTRIYSDYTQTYSTIYVVPYMAKQPKVSVLAK